MILEALNGLRSYANDQIRDSVKFNEYFEVEFWRGYFFGVSAASIEVEKMLNEKIIEEKTTIKE